ncbi:MAG: urea carboxylase-associated family protein [Kiloniellales bacterium]
MDSTFETIRVPARRGRAVRVPRGAELRVVNIHGGQVVDTWALNPRDPAEYLAMDHSRIEHYRLFFQPGDTLLTNLGRAILSLVEDHSPGIHDTLCPPCDRRSYQLLGGGDDHDNCRDNFHAALREVGIAPPVVPTPWNLFMHTVVVDNRTLEDRPSEAKPGDYVSLRAEMDCVLVFSCCPQDLLTTNGPDRTPKDIEVEVRRRP